MIHHKRPKIAATAGDSGLHSKTAVIAARLAQRSFPITSTPTVARQHADVAPTTAPAETRTPKRSARSRSIERYNYETLEQVLGRFPVKNDHEVAHIYGIIVQYDDFKRELTIMDETRDGFTLYVNLYYNEEAAALKNGTNIGNVPKAIQRTGSIIPHVQAKRLPTRTGDIIRIHRLALCKNFTRKSMRVQDIMIFQSFKNGSLTPLHYSNKPSYSHHDLKRVQELTDFNVKRLLRAEATPLLRAMNTRSLVTDVAFQVLAVLKLEKRIILACWNGRPFEHYQCQPSIDFERIWYGLRQCAPLHLYTYPFTKQLYDEHKLVFINVYGEHRVAAEVLQPTEVIAVYNLIIKPDDFHYGMFSFLMYRTDKYGRCIRVCEPQSMMAKLVCERIKNYYLLDGDIPDYENYQFDQSPSVIMSPSQIYDDGTAQTPTTGGQATSQSQSTPKRATKWTRKIIRKASQLSKTFDETMSDSMMEQLVVFNIDCEHVQWSEIERECIHRHFFKRDIPISVAAENNDSTEPIKVRSFNDLGILLRMGCFNGGQFQVKARFQSLLLQSNLLDSDFRFASMDSLRAHGCSVRCGTCESKWSFDGFLEQTTKYELQNGSLVPKAGQTPVPLTPPLFPGTSVAATDPNHLDRLVCPRCKQCSCILHLDMRFLLQDYDGQSLVGRLTNQHANVLLATCTRELCSATSSLIERMAGLFRYMVHLTNDKSTCSKKIVWTLNANVIPALSTTDNQEYEHDILGWATEPTIGIGCRM